MLTFPALVLPLVAGLNMKMSAVLGLSFWMYLLFGLTALPWGMAGDRWGGKRLMLVMFAGAGLSGLIAAFSTENPFRLTIAMAGLGLFSGIYHPIGLGLISKGVERLSVAMGYNAVFGGLGLVCAPLITGVMNWLYGPSAAFLFLAGINLAGSVLMIFLPLDDARVPAKAPSKGSDGMLGAFLILLMAMMLGGIAYRGATVILPAYLELKGAGLFHAAAGVFGRDLSGNLMATTIAAVVYTVGMIGQFIGGHVGERFEERRSYLVFHAMCIPAAFFMAFAQNLPLVGLALVYFFFLLGMQPIENTLVARLTPQRLHHSAFGMKFILTFGVGSLAVKLVQWIDTTWGIDATFPALSFVSVLIVASIICLIVKTNRDAVSTSG
jgi:MFS family permease